MDSVLFRTVTLSRLAGAGRDDSRTEAPQYPIERLMACSTGQQTLGKPGQHGDGGVTSPAWAVLARVPLVDCDPAWPAWRAGSCKLEQHGPQNPSLVGGRSHGGGEVMGCSQLPTTTSRCGRVAVVRRRPIRACRRMVH